MDAKTFKEILLYRQQECSTTLLAKAKEYATDEDRLANFKKGTEVGLRKTPEATLWDYLTKHLVSVRDMVELIEKRHLAVDPPEMLTYYWISEKIGDCINYFHLLEGLLRERIDNSESLFSFETPEEKNNGDVQMSPLPKSKQDRRKSGRRKPKVQKT